MVWKDEWVQIFVWQSKAAQHRDDMFAGELESFVMRDLISGAASEMDWEVLVLGMSVAFMHA